MLRGFGAKDQDPCQDSNQWTSSICKAVSERLRTQRYRHQSVFGQLSHFLLKRKFGNNQTYSHWLPRPRVVRPVSLSHPKGLEDLEAWGGVNRERLSYCQRCGAGRCSSRFKGAVPFFSTQDGWQCWHSVQKCVFLFTNTGGGLPPSFNSARAEFHEHEGSRDCRGLCFFLFLLYLWLL